MYSTDSIHNSLVCALVKLIYDFINNEDKRFEEIIEQESSSCPSVSCTSFIRKEIKVSSAHCDERLHLLEYLFLCFVGID